MTGTKNAKSLVVVLAAGTEGKEMEHCVCTACLFLVLLNQNQSNRDSMHNFIMRNSFSFEKTPNKTALFYASFLDKNGIFTQKFVCRTLPTMGYVWLATASKEELIDE